MKTEEKIKRNHERAQHIVNSWPTWKREFSITKYSIKQDSKDNKKPN
ncbi:hypothetical protein [Marinobacter zhanjiangensis]|uniref:Uncharacterized protein n=1 Tax=Marinobacter zhanjiangensis TaxID=578215 RepID=A0ABQ3B7M0_9GAMM|nr:hypothetical protein [Marinobacter zhanjiangensis]GGY83666.1 hypothetical protein GCM10007071_33720 [Marinobacter zhanjiangensis]